MQLKFWRKKRKLTLSELESLTAAHGKRIGFKQISMYELGKQHPPISNFVVLAEVLDVSLDELMFGERPRHACRQRRHHAGSSLGQQAGV